MTAVVIKQCHGGFGLSRDAVLLGRQLSGDPRWGGSTIKGDRRSDGTEVERDYGYVEVPGDDPILVQVVRALGRDRASSRLASLAVIEIPDDVDWIIEEYDGCEWIAEVHRTWPS